MNYTSTQKLNGDFCHEKLLEKQPLCAYDDNNDYWAWKKEVNDIYNKLLGDLPKDRCALNIVIEHEVRLDGYREIKLSFDSEKTSRIPAYLLIPNGAAKPCPVFVCLQGHSSGMHISMGKSIFEGDDSLIPSRSFAVHAIKHGYAALVIEQRGMGQRRTVLSQRWPHRNCDFTSYTAMLLGRTLIGERVLDVSRAIDVLHTFEEIDTSRICCVGNSGGGTAAYYSACFDNRIYMTVASCCISTYKDSIGSIYHCSCNYIPSIAKYFDMGELAAMIAPRKLLIVSGIKDEIFPIEGARKVSQVIQSIYDKEKAQDKYRFLEAPYAHDFEEGLVWGEVDNFMRT